MPQATIPGHKLFRKGLGKFGTPSRFSIDAARVAFQKTARQWANGLTVTYPKLALRLKFSSFQELNAVDRCGSRFDGGESPISRDEQRRKAAARVEGDRSVNHGVSV
jgi:hypothetical protein